MTPVGVMPVRVLLDEAMRRLRAHLRSLFPPFAAIFMVLGGLTVLVQVGMMERMASGDLASGCGAVAAMYLVIGVMTFVYAPMTVAALDAVAGRPVSIGRAWRFVLRPRVLLTVIGTGVLVLAAYLMCFFPALYVWPLLALTLPVMVEEGRLGADAIGRSATLVGTNPFEDFPRNPLIRLLVFMVVSAAISFAGTLVVQVPFQIAQQVLVLRQAAAEEALSAMTSPAALTLQATGALLGSLVTTVVGLYSVFGIALLYHDTRNRREGADLEAAAAELAALRGPAPAEETAT